MALQSQWDFPTVCMGPDIYAVRVNTLGPCDRISPTGKMAHGPPTEFWFTKAPPFFFFVSRKRRMETDRNRTVYGILSENVTCCGAQESQYTQDSRPSLSICSKTGMLKILKSSWSIATVMLGKWVLYAFRKLMTWTIRIFRTPLTKQQIQLYIWFALLLCADQSCLSLGGAFPLPELQVLPLLNTRPGPGGLWGPSPLWNSDVLKCVLAESFFLFF